jgi:hypothetical protein
MTDRDKLAADALARHLAYRRGDWWDHLDPRAQAVHRADALDYISIVGPIYQTRTDTEPFPRPRGAER